MFESKTHHKVIAGVLTTLILGGTTAVIINTPKPIEVRDPQVLVWDKPSTNEEWAEDVKVESLHILTTKAIEESIVRHTEKLREEEEAMKRFDVIIESGQDPVNILYFEWYERLKELDPSLTDEALKVEARNYAKEDYHGRIYSIEKLKQSIERMNKEVELRKSGYLQVAEEPKGLFGASVPEHRIRHTALYE